MTETASASHMKYYLNDAAFMTALPAFEAWRDSLGFTDTLTARLPAKTDTPEHSDKPEAGTTDAVVSGNWKLVQFVPVFIAQKDMNPAKNEDDTPKYPDAKAGYYGPTGSTFNHQTMLSSLGFCRLHRGVWEVFLHIVPHMCETEAQELALAELVAALTLAQLRMQVDEPVPVPEPVEAPAVESAAAAE